MRLTHKNYFTPFNTYLTASKIKDYLFDPYYFYRKHFLREIKEKSLDVFVIGSATDAWLTQGKRVFNKKFKVPKNRNLKNPPTTHTELTPAQFETVCGICEAVEKHDAYKDLKDHKPQVILKIDENLGDFFCGRAGILDWLQIKKNKAIITDLKTSNTINEYFYQKNCEEFGYYLSASMYCFLVEYNFPEVDKIEFRHLVVEKDRHNTYPIQTFILDPKKIQKAFSLLEETTLKIKKTKVWKPKNVSWKDAIKI